ncbi:MAG TPA: MOSC domain-containing protein [Longimicrobiaceae bacterium]|nr:MOSC domain-containing protein [Longimicrobiaceae bacterium]
MTPLLASIQVALPQEYGAPGAERAMDRPWTTAFFKEPVAGPVWLGATNLAGDRQADPKHHGGPDKAVLAYAAAHYPGWRAELYLELPYGAFGENFTVAGLDEASVCIGDVYEVGGAVVQVTQPRIPCWKIARRWKVKDLSARVQRSGRTGWYLCVLREGEVAAGDELRRVERSYPEWSIARANAALYTRPAMVDEVRALATCPGLAASLRMALAGYLAQQHDPEADGDARRLVGPNAE